MSAPLSHAVLETEWSFRVLGALPSGPTLSTSIDSSSGLLLGRPLVTSAPRLLWVTTQDADRSKADIPADGPHVGQLRLLKDVNGVFRPGVLTALMGASGAGG